MFSIAGFLLAVSSIDYVSCLTCLYCTSIQSPRHCNFVMNCSHGEVCNVHQTTSHYGDVVFDVGCAHPSACSNRTHGSKTCDECCSTDLCNAAGCGMSGYPAGRGPVCYDCLAQIKEGTCHTIDVCGGNEVCMINLKREFGDPVYTSGCVGLTHCERHTMDISQIIGRSISDDTRSLSESVCHKCCHDDLCNAHCDIEYCRPGLCEFGTCINTQTGYKCVCDQYYTGVNCSELKPHGKDCQDIRKFASTSGVYEVQVEGTNRAIDVYCDMTTDGGNWTVFQRRVNGSVDFYQNFSSYENGFGNVHGEFWLGLKYIHAMTSNAKSELRIDLMAADGSTAYEVFQNFRLSEASNYTLYIDQGQGSVGDSGNSLSWNRGYRFATYDNEDGINCAHQCHGAWWYHECTHVHLNGRYITPGTVSSDRQGEGGIIWRSFKGEYSLKETKMMFRRV